jgi:hypothetical protein
MVVALADETVAWLVVQSVGEWVVWLATLMAVLLVDW